MNKEPLRQGDVFEDSSGNIHLVLSKKPNEIIYKVLKIKRKWFACMGDSSELWRMSSDCAYKTKLDTNICKIYKLLYG